MNLKQPTSILLTRSSSKEKTLSSKCFLFESTKQSYDIGNITYNIGNIILKKKEQINICLMNLPQIVQAV